MLRYLILLLLIFVSSCATFKNIKKSELEIYVTNTAKFKLMNDDFIDEDISLNQQIKGEFLDPEKEGDQKRKFRLNTIIELSKNRIKITALTSFGNRLITAELMNNNIKFWHSSFVDGDKVKPEYIIADIQLIYLPIEKIKKNISGDLTVKETETKDGLQRVFLSKKEEIIRISYSKKDKFISEISFHNFLRNYHYLINQISQNPDF